MEPEVPVKVTFVREIGVGEVVEMEVKKRRVLIHVTE